MAETTVDMGVITRSFRSALDETAGQFKKASNDSTINLSKIVKDISTMFKGQRGDIAELTNAVQESVSESQQTSNKIESQTSIFREMLSYQVDMITQLKNISSNLKTLNDSTVSLSNQMIGAGSNSLLGGLLSPTAGVGKRVAEALLAAGIGAAAGATAVSTMGGGGGGGELTNYSGTEQSAKAAADRYAGRTLSANEWSELVKATNAEAGQKNQSEAAMVMASIINRSRDKGKSIEQVLREPNQFQAVTGTKFNPGPSTAFQQGPGEKRAEQIYGAAANILEKVSKQQKDFTAASSAAYGAGTNIGYREKMLAAGGSVVGASVFNTAAPNLNGATTTSSQATPTTSQQEAPPPSATAERYEGPGTGHGPIAREMHGEKTEGSAALPSGDVVALGHALEKMGMRISEHPQFGGVKPVHKGRAHYEGRAIDVNFGTGKTESKDPVMGAKFDQLAEQLTRMGYKVYWRESGPYAAAGHNNHLHAEIPRGGEKSVPDTYQLAGTPEQRAMQGATPSAGATPSTGTSVGAPGPAAETAQQVSSAPLTSGVSAQIPPQAMGMMNQMMPMMGGMGGIGGIIGSLIPMVGSILGSLGSMETPAAPQQFASQQNPIAELLQSLSGSAATGEMMNQAAVQKQAQQEYSQEVAAMPPQPEQRQEAQTNIASNSMSGGGDGYTYNYPGDIGWPEWASMIGGNHWSEMKKYKQNMWG